MIKKVDLISYPVTKEELGVTLFLLMSITVFYRF